MGNSRDDGSSVQSRTDLERPIRTGGGEADAALQPGTVLAGCYEVRQTIGRGGMGLVVEAFDRMLGVAVAIKILRAEYAGERGWSERLAREVKLARQIHHPHVCRVFDYAQSEGRAFLIMELAGGGTLRDEIVAGTTAARPLPDRIADARAIAAGLAAIHAAGIVHRDIAPQNALRMSDGRLVLSDFGLATDSFDGMTSIHGGTIAYMAPEVVGGGRASFASDIWALGMVIHETGFGERLRWDPVVGELRSAITSRKPGRLEASLLEICRACLMPNPERRPAGAAEIAARLSEAELARSAVRRRLRRAAAVVAGAVVVAASLVGVRRVELARKHAALPVAAAAPVDPLMIIPTGEPDDWTEKSKVLAEVPDRIRCMVPLPDHHTVRFVWGYPPRAEDVDTRTGKRTPSPLVPDAYAEGCPDLTRDRKKLVYTGHAPDDRAFAFVSTHPDGRDAVPVVPIAEPSMSSDPTWLPDGETFAYEADSKHMGVFSVVTKRSMILPTVSSQFFSSFHAVIGDRVFVSTMFDTGASDIAGYVSPSLSEEVHFRLPVSTVDVGSRDGKIFLCTSSRTALSKGLMAVEPSRSTAKWAGVVRNQVIRYPLFIEGGLVFASAGWTGQLVRRLAENDTTVVPADGRFAFAEICGTHIIATRVSEHGLSVDMLDQEGKSIGPAGTPLNTVYATCSPDGRSIYYYVAGARSTIGRCQDGKCSLLVDEGTGDFSLSPAATQLAYFRSTNRGHLVRVIKTDGLGSPVDLVEADTACKPEWSGEKNVWVALKRGKRVVWTEFDTDTTHPTGRTHRGIRDCMDGVTDSWSPARKNLWARIRYTSQVRFLPEEGLPAAWRSR